MKNNTNYGVNDSSYKAAGELVGITQLVNVFYDYMDSLPEANKIRHMHPDDLTESRKKLTYFLCGWMGGPRLFSEHYGPINIPKFHQYLEIGTAERDAWLLCMEKAISEQPYEDSFKEYLIEQIRIPAERVRAMSQSEE